MGPGLNPIKTLKQKLHGSSSSVAISESPQHLSPNDTSPNTPRRSFDIFRSLKDSPRASMDSARETPRRSASASRAASAKQDTDLRQHLQGIFRLGGHKAEHSEDAIAPPKQRSPRPSGEHTPKDGVDRRKHKEEQRLAREQKRQQEAEAQELRFKEAREKDPLKDNYGSLPLATNVIHPNVHRDQAAAIGEMEEGSSVVFRARIHHIRNISAKVAFIIFRQQLDSIQGVFAVGANVSENMIKWATRLEPETVVLVHGTVQKPRAGQEEIKSTSVHFREVLVSKLFVLGTVTVKLPFHPEDIERNAGGELVEPQPKKVPSSGTHTPSIQVPEEPASEGSSAVVDESHFTPATTTLNKHTHAAHKIGYNTRLDNRLIDLRSDVSQAIFRIQAGIAKYFRRHLEDNGFIEIHTSKFQGGATESGASVFKVDYFGRTVFLAQSPQLGKQMAIAADMERVYEIGPVFRAENSNTHRHLTEFTGLDLEMAIDDHYHEVIDMLDGALLAIFRGLQSEYRREIDIVRKLYPSEDLVFPDKTVRLHFKEGVQLLRDSGWTDDGHEIDDMEDFSTRTERRLGELVKEKYGTDYYILDKFPASARPFYTMPDPDDPKRANACDFFIRGEEILSGGQRIHQAPFLEQRMKESGINPEVMKDYVDGFRQGCPPHGGGGIGLERVVFLFLKLGNIRWGTMFPRDPRSFPKAEQDALAKSVQDSANSLLGPVANTIEYQQKRLAGENPPMPKLEDLIAAYGDSPNTSWLDPFWTVWHHEETGAACGYAVSNKFALIWGRPLCDDAQIFEVCTAFYDYLKGKNLKPIWACIDKATEQVLLERMGWKCVIAVAEQRVDPVTLATEGGERSVRHKASRATKEGVTVTEKEGALTEEEQEEVVVRMQEWQQNRHGTQIYSSALYPFIDPGHRRYFLARNKEGKICGLVVLAQLSKDNGFQIKYSLDFPNAPPGTIELIVKTALEALGRAGVHAATFGGSAPDKITPMGDNWGWKVKMLTKSYTAITKTFRLTDKASFREKFGTTADPQYIAYPSGGLGLKGIEAIMEVLKADKGGGGLVTHVSQ